MILIDADELIDDLDLLIVRAIKNDSKVQYGHVRELIMQQKQIDAQPVRKGRRIECDYKHLEHGEIETESGAGLCCSECRAAFQKKKMTYKQYCAACGARMDADETAMQRAAADDYAEF